jgi:hypothetical protein
MKIPSIKKIMAQARAYRAEHWMPDAEAVIKINALSSETARVSKEWNDASRAYYAAGGKENFYTHAKKFREKYQELQRQSRSIHAQQHHDWELTLNERCLYLNAIRLAKLRYKKSR